MKRVLHVLSALDGGGVERFLFTHYSHIDSDTVRFDFVVQACAEGILERELIERGSQIWHLPSYRKHLFRNLKQLRRIIRAGGYDSVVAHQDAAAIFPLFFALRVGVPVRIAHCHNANMRQTIWRAALTCAARLLLPRLATAFCACSRAAGAWLFGAKAVESGAVRILQNAIDPESFAFDRAACRELRASLRLESAFVVGHVGRLAQQKNHRFLLGIFREVLSMEPSSVLLLAGGGELESELRQCAKNLGIAARVRFLGVRKDVPRLLLAMDVFAFPSLHEGLGIALVEAQASGLPCVASTAVPREADLTGEVEYLSLKLPASVWAERLLAARGQKREDNRALIRAAGYDAAVQFHRLARFYLGEEL